MNLRVAVIGAGISGLQTGCFLAQAGHRVTIFERQEFPPVNPSSIAGGMLAPYSEIETLPMRLVQVGLRGIALWSQILGEENAHKLIHKTGSLLLSHPADSHMLERFAKNLEILGHRWSWTGGAEIRELEPCLDRIFQKGIFIPDEAFLIPAQALEMLMECYIQHGGQIVHAEADPATLKTDFDWVVDCRGYVENLDRDLRGVLGELVIIRNKEFHLSRPVRLMHPRYPLYIIPRPDHIFAVGASMIESAGDADGLVTARSAMELLSAAFTLHPSFAVAKILHLQSGVRAAYPDNLPRLQIDSQNRYMRCNGLFRHGYLLAPVLACCIEKYITEGQPDPDLELFAGLSNHTVMQGQ